MRVSDGIARVRGEDYLPVGFLGDLLGLLLCIGFMLVLLFLVGGR